jgi:GNAT superfamily N-acetyltransferase
VTRVTDETADAVAEFMRRVWGGPVTGDRVRRSLSDGARTNPAVPGAGVPSVAYLRDAECLGYLGTIPVRLWGAGAETAAHWLKGFMVLPEHQNGPVGFALLREILRHVNVSATMTVALPARRLFQAVGYVDCGTLPNYVAILRARRVAKSVDVAGLGLPLPQSLTTSAAFAQRTGLASAVGAVAGVALSAWRAIGNFSSRALLTDASGQLPPQADIDDLWNRARHGIAAAAVRDGSYFAWRYNPRPGARYEAISVRNPSAGGRLVGIAIVRRSTDDPDPRLRGVSLATLADVLFEPDDRAAANAVLAGAEKCARRMGADALLCSAANPAITAGLERRAYFRLPGNVHLMIHEPRGERSLPSRVEEWWLMRGDANSDDAF